MPNEAFMKFTLLTLFPEMFPGPLGHSLAGKALQSGLWSFEALQIRDFAVDKHQKVDDIPYGGGAGMVMKPDVIDAAIRAARAKAPDAKLIYFTPRGVPLTQELARKFVIPRVSQSETIGGPRETERDGPIVGCANSGHDGLILLCGRYEAIDERVIEAHKPLEISVGDYVLSGGEMAAMVLMDALIRLLPGVMGDAASGEEESFEFHQDGACLLEYPHYTRPPIWDGRTVPEVLLSGNHAQISAWRRKQAEEITRTRRPDLIRKP
jgi:tRNA (guanine37-N1)-methyltransferase